MIGDAIGLGSGTNKDDSDSVITKSVIPSIPRKLDACHKVKGKLFLSRTPVRSLSLRHLQANC